MAKPSSWYARRYVEKFGFQLVPIEPARKFPRSADWGNNTISTPDQAEKFWTDNPDWNMGLALGPSRMCSLDIDCHASFLCILDEFGIDPESLNQYPTIQGSSNGSRITFRIPDGINLPYQKMSWPSRNDPTGEKHKHAMRAAAEAKSNGDTDREARIRRVAKRWASYTVFELRSSCDGQQRQDVLPPSIHPDTKQPYVWLQQPADPWPEPPAWLLAIWSNWDKFKPQIKSMCPWLPEEKSEPVKLEKSSASKTVGIKSDVIGAFCDAHDIRTMLEQYGYSRKGRQRYLSPHSSTALPGVVVLKSGDACWIHHASDPLCSDDTGKPVNAFDLFCYYEHNGDIKQAVKHAAALLGMDSRVSHTPAAPQSAPAITDDPGHLVQAGSRDYMSPLPWATDKGKPLKHIDNLHEILRRLGVTVRYNVIKKDIEIIIPGESFTMDNEANASLAWLTSECALFDFATDKLSDFLMYIADQNQFNPVARWIDSRPWDGIPRLQALCDTIKTRDAEELKNTLIRRWMIAAVAAVYLPDGISSPGVLTLQGAQYLGKTKWFKGLVPSSLDLIQDGMILKPDDKDSVKQCLSFWLVELGELDSTFRKSDIAQLKAFITKQTDVLRLPYARRESKFPRRTMFFGTVNPLVFLHDPTGNRRYWTIECVDIDHDHGLDMQQVWAEVKSLWEAGEGYYLTTDEMNALNSQNEEFTSIDPVEERLLENLDWDAPQAMWRWEQASTILIECGIDRPTKSDAMAAGDLLRKKNGGQYRRASGKRQILCPPKRLR